MATMTVENPSLFISRVQLDCYRGIQSCDVSLSPLTLLVGPNGSGKSNFLDSLAFVSEALRNSLGFAVLKRGGISEIRFGFYTFPTRFKQFSITLEFSINESLSGNFSFVYGLDQTKKPDDQLGIAWEKCELSNGSFYEISDGKVIKSSISNPPDVSIDQLYLVNVSGLNYFREVYRALSSIRIYNPSTSVMKESKSSNSKNYLEESGNNLAEIYSSIESSESKSEIVQYMKLISKRVNDVRTVKYGKSNKGLLFDFENEDRGWGNDFELDIVSVSDGTLRAFSILVAIFQNSVQDQKLRLIGIEEPENTLHPAAAGYLLEAMREASEHTQILVTTHSPDLLDRVDLTDEHESVIAVDFQHGEAVLGSIDAASREIVKRKLYSLGDLLRMNQLEPEIKTPNLEEHV